MTSLPEILYRRVNGEQALNNHLYGHLWFRSPRFFRNVKGPQHDPTEGVGSYVRGVIQYKDVGDNVGLQPEFILSFSETIQATEKFRGQCKPSYILKLKDPAGLRYFVRDELINGTCPSAVIVEWRKVEYRRDEYDYVNRELTCDEEWARKKQ